MQIAKDTVVAIHYRVETADGQPVDRSDGAPLEYLHGHGNLIAGLEQRLAGRSAGEKVDCEIPPAEGYGELDPGLDLQVPLAAFPEEARAEVKPGFRFQAEHPAQAGVVVLFRVCGLQDDQVFVSGNHPLAGQTLRFAVEVASVRAATAEELAHGHPHGQRCAHHEQGGCDRHRNGQGCDGH